MTVATDLERPAFQATKDGHREALKTPFRRRLERPAFHVAAGARLVRCLERRAFQPWFEPTSDCR